MSKQGFTLMEVLIVVIIIGILATLSMPQFEGMRIKAKMARSVTPTEVLNTGFRWIRFQTFPASPAGLARITSPCTKRCRSSRNAAMV